MTIIQGMGRTELEGVKLLHGYILLRFFDLHGEIELSNGLRVPAEMIVSRIWRIAEVISISDRKYRVTRCLNCQKTVKRPPIHHGQCDHCNGRLCTISFFPGDVVEVGDRVLIDKIFGDVVVEGRVTQAEYRVVSPDQIIAVVDDEITWIERSGTEQY